MANGARGLFGPGLSEVSALPLPATASRRAALEELRGRLQSGRVGVATGGDVATAVPIAAGEPALPSPNPTEFGAAIGLLANRLVLEPLRSARNLGRSALTGQPVDPGDVLNIPLVGGAASIATGLKGVGVFGGRVAREFPKAKEAEFNQLRSAGATADEAFNRTGFFVGADGKLRFEIPDQNASFTPVTEALIGRAQKDVLTATQKIKMSIPARAVQIFDHPELFLNYPGLRNTRVRFTNKDSEIAGQFDPIDNTITINVKDRNIQQIKATLLHEMQHAVQEIETFARGGNPDFMQFLLSKFGREDLARNRQAAFQAYRQLAGEVEARVVEQRVRSPQTLNQSVAPFRQEDLPRSQQLVLGGSQTRTRPAVPATQGFGMGLRFGRRR